MLTDTGFRVTDRGLRVNAMGVGALSSSCSYPLVSCWYPRVPPSWSLRVPAFQYILSSVCRYTLG